ncbi:MAG: tetratricopeptide repeat protein [Hormoscilla sp. GM102CHS1]|nr:tetratricopeptide repeat protein [Hormoscilla sp. GM102CHS1]
MAEIHNFMAQALAEKEVIKEHRSREKGRMAKRGKRQKLKVSRRTKQVSAPEEYSQLIYQAGVHYQTGKVREAQQICFDILKQEPNHADALHLLGDIAYGQGQYEVAIRLYEQSLASKSKNGHKLHNNIGLALEKQGKIDEAIAHYRQALSINPKHVSSHSNLGKALYLQGKISEALACWQRVLDMRPDDPKAHNNLGTAMVRQLEYDRAIRHFQQAIACKQNYAEAYKNLGIVKEKQEKYSEAIAYYQQAITLDPNRADIHNNIGLALGRQEKLSEAIAHLRRGVSLNPKEAEYNYNLAVVLQKQEKLPEAIGYYQQAIGLKPDYGQAYNNLGTVLQGQGRLTEAISYYQQAIKLEPDSAEAHNNLGTAYQDQGNITEAIASYREAIGLRPDYREARANLAPVLLLLGDWQRGFAEYEWRWQIPEFGEQNPLPPTSKPRWQGEDLQGRTLLITREQGFGDMIHFIRYAKAVREQQTGGGRVLVTCLEPTLRLFKSIPDIELLIPGSALPDFDVWAPMMSLPYILGTTAENVPARVPYLHPGEEALKRLLRTEAVKCVLLQTKKLKVGIVWSCRPNKDLIGRQRTCSLRDFIPVLELPDITFFSLQKGSQVLELSQSTYKIVNLDEFINDFADTAAVIQALDLVITVDTAVGHLAGALGKPVWVLLPFVPDWRWMLHRPDSPWYPTMQLFRQQQPGNWSEVFLAVQRALQSFLADVESQEKVVLKCKRGKVRMAK